MNSFQMKIVHRVKSRIHPSHQQAGLRQQTLTDFVFPFEISHLLNVASVEESIYKLQAAGSMAAGDLEAVSHLNKLAHSVVVQCLTIDNSS